MLLEIRISSLIDLRTEKGKKWKYTVTSEDMALQFSELVFSKQTYLFLLVLNKYNNGFMFAFAVLS